MKKLLFIFVLFLAYSHSVSAEIVRVGQSLTPTTWACIQSGMVVDTSSSICNGESSTNGSYRPISHISRSGFYLMIHFQSGSKMQAFRASRSACELPNTIVDGVCKDTFCSSSSWNNLVMQENESCAAKYPNHWTNLKSSCTDSKNYSFTCEQGIEKPDTGGGDGSGGDGDGSGGDGSG
ncbi:hypothetical protein, partial [Vibrio splendidus]|uniref:hypothetical protein n=1 Tax=Vibrio splendidus TaxID=29497 RepID=UPI0004948BF5